MVKCTIKDSSLITAVIGLLLAIMVAGKTADADVMPKQSDQTDSMSTHTLAIPNVATDYVLIYKPQPDVYVRRDSKNSKSGKIYTKWRINDHTFTQDPSGRWHCFGITRPDYDLDSATRAAGLGTFHALAPFGTLEQVFRPETWMDQPKFDVAGSSWAPYCIKIGDTYNLISSTRGHASSKDLYRWKDNGKLRIKNGRAGVDTRDPNILYWNGTYYLVRCDNRAVSLVTSTDFVNWTEPIDIFVAPVESWQCESPTLLRYNNKFYLFWCLWDSSPSREKLPALYKGHTPWSHDWRTFVYVSDTPTDFNNTEPIAQLKAHAPEIIVDEKGNYFISSADYPQRGINLARLEWKSGK